MKILFLSHRIPWPLKDGGSIAIYNNLKGFLDAGCEVKFLALKPDKDATDVSALPDVFQKAAFEYVSINTNIKAVPAFLNLLGKTSYNVERFYSAEFADLIRQNIENTAFDLVHMEGAFAGRYVDVVKSVSKLPCVLREHNVEYMIWDKMACQESHPLRQWYLEILASRLRNYEENLWKKCDLVTAITPHDMAVFANTVGGDNVFMAGAGFDLDPYLQASKTVKEKSLFHLASMDWLPNQESAHWILHKIWPEIRRNLQGYSLFLAGKKMPAEFLKYSESNGIIVEGEVPDAIDYMADKEIMLVPLLSGSGIRIKSIEAMAMGKVIISTELGHKGLGVTPGRHLLQANTTKEFIESLKYLEENPAKKEEIAREARIFAREHFDNRKVTGRLLEAYTKLLNRS